MRELFPITRSLTGNGNRETLDILSRYAKIDLKQVRSGEVLFDWIVPQEWQIDECYVENHQSGVRVIDFKRNNLHVLGYSEAVEKVLIGQELKDLLITDAHRPDSIPYVTSYYRKMAGICCSHKQLSEIKDNEYYKVKIQSRHFDGVLDYGVGQVDVGAEKTFFLSSYICHPSMANDSLSGVVIALKLLQFYQKHPERLNGFNLVVSFAPETIGALAFLDKDLNSFSPIYGGLVLTCLGDRGPLAYKRNLSDKIDLNQLIEREFNEEIRIRKFCATGSDERQFCSPGFRLPVGVLTRTPYGEFPEYHSSADNLDFVTAKQLNSSYSLTLQIIEKFTKLKFYKRKEPRGEPMLSKYSLYPTFGGLRMQHDEMVRQMMDILCYIDGKTSLDAISDIIGLDKRQVENIVNRLSKYGIVTEVQ